MQWCLHSREFSTGVVLSMQQSYCLKHVAVKVGKRCSYMHKSQRSKYANGWKQACCRLLSIVPTDHGTIRLESKCPAQLPRSVRGIRLAFKHPAQPEPGTGTKFKSGQLREPAPGSGVTPAAAVLQRMRLAEAAWQCMRYPPPAKRASAAGDACTPLAPALGERGRAPVRQAAYTLPAGVPP